MKLAEDAEEMRTTDKEKGRQKAEGRRQKAEGRRQKAEGRRQKAEGRRQKEKKETNVTTVRQSEDRSRNGKYIRSGKTLCKIEMDGDESSIG